MSNKPMKLYSGLSNMDLTGHISICIIGNSNSGKSVLCKRIIQEMYKPNSGNRRYSKICLLSPSWKFQKSLWGFLPEEFCYSDFDLDDKCNELYEDQNQRFENGLSPRNILIIADDVYGHSTTKNAGGLAKIFCQGRHVNISIIVISQHLAGLLSPVIRSNTHHFIVGKLSDSNLDTHLKSLYSKDRASAEVLQHSHPYSFLVSNRTNKAGTDEVYGLKIPLESLSKTFKITLSAGQRIENLTGYGGL